MAGGRASCTPAQGAVEHIRGRTNCRAIASRLSCDTTDARARRPRRNACRIGARSFGRDPMAEIAEPVGRQPQTSAARWHSKAAHRFRRGCVGVKALDCAAFRQRQRRAVAAPRQQHAGLFEQLPDRGDPVGEATALYPQHVARRRVVQDIAQRGSSVNDRRLQGPPGNTCTPGTKTEFRLRFSISTSGPSAVSRTSVTVAAGRGVISSQQQRRSRPADERTRARTGMISR